MDTVEELNSGKQNIELRVRSDDTPSNESQTAQDQSEAIDVISLSEIIQYHDGTETDYVSEVDATQK